MKAPRSQRPVWLGRGCLVFLVGGQVLSPLVMWIFGLHPITNQNHPTVFYFVGLPLGLIFLAIGIAYFVSRINDGLDQEARERRAAGRADIPLAR